MSNVVIKKLDPEQFYLLEPFCEEEGIPMLDPQWATVVAAIDLDTEKVVGIVVTQLQAHAEPIWIKREYQGNGLVEELVDTMEGYLEMMALTKGPFATYNQPTNAAAERICRMRGYEKSDKPLYVKIYGGKLWQAQSHQQSG